MLIASIGCGGESSNGQEETAKTESGAAPIASGGAFIEGEITETMESGGYTYVLVASEDGPVWAAGPVTPIAAGTRVRISTGMQMSDFHSETLDRTFDAIYFVSSFDTSGSAGTGEPVGGTSTVPKKNEVVEGIEKAPGGLTVAEIYAGKSGLAGKSVTVRGSVVKFNAGILGTNWLHLQDGTCEGESCDLTVTTDETVDVGAVITVQGVLAIDKDFGAGYRYEVIVEGATLVKH